MNFGDPKGGLSVRDVEDADEASHTADEPASEDLRTKFRALVKERAEGKPVAYLVGHRERKGSRADASTRGLRGAPARHLGGPPFEPMPRARSPERRGGPGGPPPAPGGARATGGRARPQKSPR